MSTLLLIIANGIFLYTGHDVFWAKANLAVYGLSIFLTLYSGLFCLDKKAYEESLKASKETGLPVRFSNQPKTFLIYYSVALSAKLMFIISTLILCGKVIIEQLT